MTDKSVQPAIFWFRRDLRLEDNTGLAEALRHHQAVIPLFIYDDNILNDLEDKYDRRVDFISESLSALQKQLQAYGSSMLVLKGEPAFVFSGLLKEYEIAAVYANHDYEPYAIKRDANVHELLLKKNIPLKTFKDQCIFEKNEILKQDGTPYTVFTPYSNVWKALLKNKTGTTTKIDPSSFYKFNSPLPSIESIGFKKTDLKFKKPVLRSLDLVNYDKTRNVPALNATSHLSPHLRFGTVSVREILELGSKQNESFVNELIWRDFFMMILYHFPEVTDRSFKIKYESIRWRNKQPEFEAWCHGQTGYPLVDAGMRELLATGLMHNRVRMVCAGFLIKHLLVDWRWGEAWFAMKLLDYDLSANNGNWQWAAGCGCDAAPYFRIFNPTEQQKKFDPDFVYVKRWVPEFGTPAYPKPIVEHSQARIRVFAAYNEALT